MSNKNLLVISINDPTDIKSFSGISYHACKALESHYVVEIVFISAIPFWVRMYGKIMNRVFSNRYRLKNSTLYSWVLSKQIQKQLKKKQKQYEYLLFFNCVQLLAHFDKTVCPKSKIVYYSDSTFQLGLDYYPALTNLSNFNIKEGHTIDSKAYNNADLILLSSEWAASSVVNYYNVEPSKVKVLKYGANLPDLSYRKRIFEKQISLLIVGVEWKRKGINIAIEVHKRLLEMGYASQLTIIGLKQYPAEVHSIQNLFLHTFINKGSTEGTMQLKKEFENANYFLFPTLADCTPIVLAESMMFGLPIIARNTGGLSSMVENEVNGFLIDETGTVDDFINALLKIHVAGVYERFSENSRHLYETQFNWDVWLTKFKDHVASI
ncbi:glycosyltransferase family 4 protein [Cytophagaceae bacterium YF14B1]|uniref:Glycosyltransferase family 4 protein n=1 Tax=Xanthocytophaga flava TaxID=3048013 RepID=A0AAE3QTX2_9BACT|nr:glycosyltransferase family 4 protein [Xanthocytophaga flavus]MDJ1484881.1 glycosyltransferase family 4 protein [Xanthocytophaga flavus]